MTFADRLAEAVRARGPLCVGLDPRLDMLPAEYRQRDPAEAVEAFCLEVLELVRPFSGVVKPQAAFFELLGPTGFQAMAGVVRRAKEMGFITILDAKRGDIASTAEAYAEAAFRVWDADALTVNPYLGEDAVAPFLKAARAASPARGNFVLVRTSNPGGGLFQNLDCGGEPLYRHVARRVGEWNEGHGDVGAVVGATNPKELAELRGLLPGVWFLVPGYGAQGGSASDIRAAYDADGLGAVVNSSRGVVFPFQPDDPQWKSRIVAAAQAAQRDLAPVH